MNQRYRNLFENWQVGVAINVVREFKAKWKCLEKEDEEDLLQECLAHWLFARDNYDPAGGASQATYMARIIRNKLMDLVREQSSDKRKAVHFSDSIDQPLNDDEGASSLLDILASDSDFHLKAELKVSIEQSFSKLTNTQKELCQYLSAGSVNLTELAETLGIGRATIYREIERIRSVFEQEGLKDFLK